MIVLSIRTFVRLALMSGAAALSALAIAQGPVEQEAYLKASNQGGAFGTSVAVSGDTVVVGAWAEGGTGGLLSGAAFVFVRTASGWSQQAHLDASNADPGDFFGTSLALSGDTLVVGAHGEDSGAKEVNGDQMDDSLSNAGAAYVFVRQGTEWTQQAYLKASNTGIGDRFGSMVAIFGDTIVVAADEEDSGATGVDGDETDNGAPNAGAVYVFVRNGTEWSQQAYLKASNTDSGDEFGQSVAIWGNRIVVGAWLEDGSSTGANGDEDDDSAADAGAAYVFARDGTKWSQQAYLKASNTDPGDWFGYSVTVSGDKVVVGALGESSGFVGAQDDNSAYHAGAAYAFVPSGTSWRQEQYLKASNVEGGDLIVSGDSFGFPVALSGSALVVSSRLEDSSATGVYGPEDDGVSDAQNDNSSQYAGAVYRFAHSAAGWTQTAYIKASNTDPQDFFGTGLAISGDTIVAGAPLEHSSATGVNGDEDDNSRGASGAAYVFDSQGIGLNYCGAGVPNSIGGPGGIRAFGSQDANDEDLTLRAFNLPPGNVCLFLTSVNQGFIPFPGTSCGNICLMGPDVARFKFDAQIVDSAGQCLLHIDPFLALTNPPQPIQNGQTWNFQAWHRDAGAQPACDNNFTDALSITFTP